MNLRSHPRSLLASLTTLVGVLLLAPGVASAADEPALNPSDEFALPPWISIRIGGLDLSINKAVFYVVVATILTCVVMIYAARRMATRPSGRLQVVLEGAFGLMRDNITRGNMDSKMAAKWFPFIATLFLFIWFSNMIGYIPMPTNTHEKFSLFGLEIPSFALYAATANISVPLVLALVVWISYHVEGIRVHGPLGYVRSWVPKGVEGFMVGPILAIEALSHFVRLISLSLRLFANILAGHLLILFMAGGLVVLLGMGVFGSVILGVSTGTLAVVFFLFEIGLVATLQAFIFSTLTAIYLGGAVAEEH
ncbi:F0F1 ATP synthase subunit A [Conexibacter sp. JD483]|uniref:F0F1 ATP synthase subunit A n=1 Tax=unclassified Conexibacter TaxID=2627773 RepID=UPI0027240296|nr:MULTISPECIES: F0F1 ATP synthase subunit A [unclassified Conexibacter]MDO8186760.1 F0F1 ATP synthase subunit A [Conexibacter sp. CPCC 205706]MDO8199046.1 F0F1 ATP synthase subunit A [Conexibacter sp. CPCC 205762]MDR9368498.1 F0F1 ATP synthase subunit A [Conexibacter sp. JD483]